MFIQCLVLTVQHGAGVTACSCMSLVPSVCTSTSYSGLSSVTSVGTTSFISAPLVPNMGTSYMGLAAGVITPHDISPKKA